MVSSIAISKCLNHFTRINPGVDKLSSEQWQIRRNRWMNELGIAGVVVGSEKMETIPMWWQGDVNFWFISEELETFFVLKYGR